MTAVLPKPQHAPPCGLQKPERAAACAGEREDAHVSSSGAADFAYTVPPAHGPAVRDGAGAALPELPDAAQLWQREGSLVKLWFAVGCSKGPSRAAVLLLASVVPGSLPASCASVPARARRMAAMRRSLQVTLISSLFWLELGFVAGLTGVVGSSMTLFACCRRRDNNIAATLSVRPRPTPAPCRACCKGVFCGTAGSACRTSPRDGLIVIGRVAHCFCMSMLGTWLDSCHASKIAEQHDVTLFH